MIELLRSTSENGRSRRHVASELTHDSFVVWLTRSRYVGNGLEGLGAAREVQHHYKTCAKTHGKIRPEAPKPLPTKRLSVSNITRESHIGLSVTWLLERTLPFETKAIQALAQVFHVLVF